MPTVLQMKRLEELIMGRQHLFLNSGGRVGERTKVPPCEWLYDLSVVTTHFRHSLVSLQQHRIHQWRIINLQNIIQSPSEPSNCMLQLIEVLIPLLELLCNFSLNRSLDGEKSKAQQKWIIRTLSWLCNDIGRARLTTYIHTHTHTYPKPSNINSGLFSSC